MLMFIHILECMAQKVPIINGNELLPSMSPGPGAIALHGRAHSVQAETRWCFCERRGQDQLTSEYGSVCEKIHGKCFVYSRRWRDSWRVARHEARY